MKLLESIRNGSFVSRRVIPIASVSLLAGCSAGASHGEGAENGAATPATGTPSSNGGTRPPVSSSAPQGGGNAAPGRVDEGTPSLPLGSSSGGAGPVASGGSPGLAGSGGAPTPGVGGGTGAPPSRGGCLNPGNGDYASAGPYRVATQVIDLGEGIAPNQGTGEFTIFYPEPFEAECPHPIVAWGNGTGVTGPAVYEFFNRNAASWGVVVIAAHDSNTGSGNYHRAGIDYLLEQNAASGSQFFGKLSDRAGVTGHSQGGFGASQAAAHPNVRALVPVGASGRPLATTAFLCLTGTEDIAPDACRTAVQGAPGPAMAAIWEGGDHVVTETVAGFLAGDPGTIQMMRLYAAWFRCYLADDAVACDLFEGQSCGICSDSGWAELVTNNL